MTNRELYYTLSDNLSHGVNVNSLNSVRSSLRTYFVSRCLHPVKLRVFDSALGRFVPKVVNCGSCDFCRSIKVNSWVTRLYSHLEDYKYCYFVTLTYRSFTEKELNNNYNNMLFNYLSDVFWHYDNYNSTKRYCYRPCMICVSHLSAFLKRLRTNTNNNTLTFFACAEYGHKFASPHYHLILFSNQPVSPLDINRAWGRFFRVGKRFVFKSFGRTQFDNLVENGTLSNSVCVHNKRLSGHACFSYVAKYCGKLEFNNKRLLYAYNILSNFEKSFNYEVKNLRQEIVTKSSRNDFPNFKEFCKLYSPRINVSRGTPIGSLWCSRHITEMAEGTFCVPPLQKADNVAFVRPSYFYRKVKDYLFPLKALNRNCNYSTINVPQFVSYICSSLSRSIPYFCHSFVGKVGVLSNSFVVPVAQLDNYSVNFAVKHYSFVDVVTRKRILFLYDNGSLYCHYLRYSRSLKDYVFYGFVPFTDFIQSFLNNLPLYFKFHKKRLSSQSVNDHYQSLVNDIINKYDLRSCVSSVIGDIESHNSSFNYLHDTKRYQDSKL